MKEVEEIVLKIIADVVALDVDEIKKNMYFFDLETSFADLKKIRAEIEHFFDIDLPDDCVKKTNTIWSVIESIKEKVE